MSEERKVSVANALRAYRKTVREHNWTLLSIVIEGLQVAGAPESWDESKLEENRFRVLREYMPDMSGVVARTSEILELSPEILEKYIPDGANDQLWGQPIDVLKRQQWLDAVLNHIEGHRTTSDTGASMPTSLPEDLEIIINMVYSIEGPYLHRLYYFSNGCPFFEGTDVEKSDQKSIRRQVLVRPVRDSIAYDEDVVNYRKLYSETDCVDLNYTWEDVNISVAIMLGKGAGPGTAWVCYCNCPDSIREKDKEWLWRYGITSAADGWESELYDSIEEFLEFYAHFRKESAEHIRLSCPDEDEPLRNLVAMGPYVVQ